MINTYVSIDLETTGLNPKQDRIIEIGALKVVDGKEAGEFSCFVNPRRKLEERIVELTGIRDEDLRGAPEMGEIMPSLAEFLEDYPLLGHSIRFDYSFLKKAAVNQGMTFSKEALDTLQIARKYLADLEHRNLDYLCDHYKIPHHAHRALEDARATSLLYRKLTEHFYQEEEPLFVPREIHYHVKPDRPASKTQKDKLYRLLAQHKIVPDMEIESLTRSEASRFTDKILAEYGR